MSNPKQFPQDFYGQPIETALGIMYIVDMSKPITYEGHDAPWEPLDGSNWLGLCTLKAKYE